MCGIAAFIGNNTDVGSKFFEKVLPLLKHRGPNDEGTWTLPGHLGLLHVRLSIQDTSMAAHQPMHSSDGRYVIIFNGEIYNHLDLRRQYLPNKHFDSHSDTATILALYHLLGVECFEKLVGMWALMLYDKATNELIISRDRFGQKPLYYRQFNGSYYFSSELKPLMTLGNNHAEPTAVTEFLALGNYGHLGDRTFFKEIRQFPLAHNAVWNLNEPTWTSKPYWQYPHLTDSDRRPFDEATRKILRDTIVDAVLSQTISDVPIGITLSGGIDSSVIAGILARNYNQPLEVFTAQTPGHAHDETRYVDAVWNFVDRKDWQLHTSFLQSLRWEDIETSISIQEEPFGDPSIMAHHLLVKAAAREGVRVLLGGQGADEMFAGYDYNLIPILVRQFRHGQWKLLGQNLKGIGWGKSQLARLALTSVAPAMEMHLRAKSRQKRKGFIASEWAAHENMDLLTLARNDRFAAVQVDSVWGIHLPHLLHYDDRNTMSLGIEGRTPFLDHRIADILSTIKVDDWVKNGERKHLLRSACAEFLPTMLQQRRDKIGFYTPLHEMLWDNIAEIEKTLESGLPASMYDNLQPDLEFYRKKVANIEASRRIWRSYLVVVWQKMFLESASQDISQPSFINA